MFHSNTSTRGEVVLSPSATIAIDDAVKLIGPLCIWPISLRATSDEESATVQLIYDFQTEEFGLKAILCTLSVLRPCSLRDVAQDVFMAWLGNKHLWGDNGLNLYAQWVRFNEAAIARGETVIYGDMATSYDSLMQLRVADLRGGNDDSFYTELLKAQRPIEGPRSTIQQWCMLIAGDDCIVRLGPEFHHTFCKAPPFYAIEVSRGEFSIKLKLFCDTTCEVFAASMQLYRQLSEANALCNRVAAGGHYEAYAKKIALITDAWWRVFKEVMRLSTRISDLSLDRASIVEPSAIPFALDDPYEFYHTVKVTQQPGWTPRIRSELAAVEP